MRMKTGTKVLLLAVLFTGVGFWAGRGFPRTWEAFRNPDGPVAASAESAAGGSIALRRIDELEARISDLERGMAEVANARPPSAGYPSVPLGPSDPAPPAPAPMPATPFPAEAPEGSL